MYNFTDYSICGTSAYCAIPSILFNITKIVMYGVGDHYSLHYDGYYELRGNRDYDTDGYRAGVWVGNR